MINLEEYYDKYSAMVFRRCKMLLRDDSAAEDAMQDVFVSLIRNQEKIYDKFPSGFLNRIATNICLNILRSEKKKFFITDERLLKSIASTENIEDASIINSFLDDIFQQEKPKTREIAFMFYIDRMTYEQIGKELGLSASGTRKRLQKLRKNLQERNFL